MKKILVFSLTVALMIASISVTLPSVHAAEIPGWIKNTAGWWADGTIDDGSFVSGIEWLVSNDIIQVPATAVSSSAESSIPSWIKNTAGWWADGTIDDGSFVNAIQHLIKVGIMTIPQTEQVVPEKSNVSSNADPELINESKKLKSKIDECQQKNTEADIYLCESKFKKQLAIIELMMEANKYEAGPVNFYYQPALVEISPSGNSFVELVLVMRNTDTEIHSLYCSGPESCNMTFTDGKNSWKYAANDIPTGRLAMLPDNIILDVFPKYLIVFCIGVFFSEFHLFSTRYVYELPFTILCRRNTILFYS